MILPNPVKFLTSCEYERVALDQALGDELFLALHLIMHGCRNYMARLKHYHNEQYDSLGKRELYLLSELKMCRLKDYEKIPSPEEIRAIVAECVTANVGFVQHFIDKIFVVEKSDLPTERDNTAVLKLIRGMNRGKRGTVMSNAVREILKMPASAVGACHCFHSSDLLMQVAMRQFGIALLIVHDDDELSDRWPYQTPHFLDLLGSRVFLPLTFGCLHTPRSGHLAILRKNSLRSESYRGAIPCYQGYALEMKSDIRTKHVNLLAGLFDLSYTRFADYVENPRRAGRNAPKVKRDYREASYEELVFFKQKSEEYQVYLQETRRKKAEQRAKAAPPEEESKRPPPNHGHGTRSARAGASARDRRDTEAAEMPHNEPDLQEGRDMMHRENNVMSYVGNTDKDQDKNMTWFLKEYLPLWPSPTEPEDMTGQHQTIEQSLRLLGKKIHTKEQCSKFLADHTRKDIIVKCNKWYKSVLFKIHPDHFNNKVKDEGMQKENNDRFNAVTIAKNALMEWDEVALDKAKIRKAEQGTLQLENLLSWESMIHVPKEGEWMDYTEFQQQKRQRKEN